MCIGDPCTPGKREVTWTALTTFSCGIDLIDTTIGPENGPAGTVGMLVMYIETLVPFSKCGNFIPLVISADSNEKLHPSKNDTKSSFHTSWRSDISEVNSPFSYTLYKGMSVRMSLLGAVVNTSICPGSKTSMSGQGLGFLWQNRRKSKESSFGRMAKFACTCPGATPAVGRSNFPLLIRFLISLGLSVTSETVVISTLLLRVPVYLYSLVYQ